MYLRNTIYCTFLQKLAWLISTIIFFGTLLSFPWQSTIRGGTPMAHGGLERPRVQPELYCESRICAQFAGGLISDEIGHRHWFGGSCARHMAAKTTWLGDHLPRVRGVTACITECTSVGLQRRGTSKSCRSIQRGFAAHLGLTIRGQYSRQEQEDHTQQNVIPALVRRFRDSPDTRKLLYTEGLVPVLPSFGGCTYCSSCYHSAAVAFEAKS
jgi:hypothetical protein